MNSELYSSLFPADVLLTHGEKSLVSKTIRWFTRHRNEPPTYTNHAAIMDDERQVTEAKHTVVSSSFDVWDSEHESYQIWRKKDLTLDERISVGAKARNYRGKKYGYVKIALCAGDGLVGKLIGKDFYFFRRFAFLGRFPICSWLVTYCYWSINYVFGIEPSRATPDDIHDHVVKSDRWFMVYEKKAGLV